MARAQQADHAEDRVMGKQAGSEWAGITGKTGQEPAGHKQANAGDGPKWERYLSPQ